MSNTVADFTIGQRVQLAPHLDLWMRGARFGTVERIGTFYIYVRVDALNAIRRFSPDNLQNAEV